MLDFVHEDSLGVLSMPTSIAASTDQETSRRINHYEPPTLASGEHHDGTVRLTHLRNIATVMSRNNLELNSALHLAIGVRLSFFGDVPQTNVIRGGAITCLVKLMLEW